MVMASVQRGRPDMRKKAVLAIIVRQKKEFRRPNGKRIKFEDNAAIVVKDEKGNPQGSLIKGPVAKEVTVRWPLVAKLASNVA
jgi:large subunit ribosomal protein L14